MALTSNLDPTYRFIINAVEFGVFLDGPEHLLEWRENGPIGSGWYSTGCFNDELLQGVALELARVVASARHLK